MIEDHFHLVGEEVKAEPFHYKGCGLEGIYLLNGYQLEEHGGEEYVSITELEKLHQAIGRHIVSHRKALAPKEVRFLRNTMGLTQANLAEILGTTSQSVARWEKGECEMPGASEKLIRVIFLANLMTDEEFAEFRKFLTKTLTELDRVDQFAPTSAQFELFDGWRETEAA